MKNEFYWATMLSLLVVAVALIVVIDFGTSHVSAQQSGLVASNGLFLDGSGRLFVRQYNAAGSTDPCQNPDQLKSSAKITLTSTTAQKVVAASGTTKVYVCGFSATIQGSATTVGTLQFETGTTVTNPCDTTTATLTDVFQGNITASVPTLVTSPGGGFTNFTGAASGDLCAVATGTTISVKGYITFVQQ